MIPIALTIAGSDPSGGAGLQADLKTFQAHGVYGLSVTTAITVQNSKGVCAVHPLPANQIKEQLANLLADFCIQSIKIGMLGSSENARVVAEFIENSINKSVVLDPIIKSQSGFDLNSDKCLRIIEEGLFPNSLIITPNVEEAAQLCQTPIDSLVSMSEAASRLNKLGANNVLIKGGQFEEGTVCDLFFDGKNHFFRHWPKQPGFSPHGTGCVLSSAIAANLALGQLMTQAVANAQNYLQDLRQHTIKIGEGYPYLSFLKPE